MDLRTRLGLIGGGAFLIFIGVQGISTAATNRSPTAVSCADYVPSQVKGKWLELKDCEVLLADGSHFYTTDSLADADQVYIPLHVPGHDQTAKSRVYLASRDPELLAIYNGFSGITSEAQAEAYIERHRAKLAEVRTVSGLVRYGIDLDDREISLLRGSGDVADEFVVVDEGKKPTLGIPIAALLGGIALVLGGLGVHRLIFDGRDTDRGSLPTAPGGARPA